MDQHKFRDTLRRYREGVCTDEEKLLIEQWYNLIDNKGRESDSSLNGNEDVLKKRLWNNINNELFFVNQKETSRYKSHSRIARPVTLAIAASILFLILFIGLLLRHSERTFLPGVVNSVLPGKEIKKIVNTDDHSKEVQLPDGSSILLDPYSQISYSGLFNENQRQVFLEGKAFFKVAKDPNRPFLVYANEVIAKAVGTSFVIKAFKKDIEIKVIVKTGKVSVYTKSKNYNKKAEPDETIITPNQQAVYNRNNKTLNKMLVENPEPLILKGDIKRTNFEDAPIAEIFHAIEEIYQIKIEFDEKLYAECKLTTTISDSGIYDRLNIICTAIGAKYKIVGTKIVIEGSGC